MRRIGMCAPFVVLALIGCGSSGGGGLQLTESHSVATPVDWKNGDPVVIVPSLKDPEILRLKFPKGWREVKPYLRLTPQPD